MSFHSTSSPDEFSPNYTAITNHQGLFAIHRYPDRFTLYSDTRTRIFPCFGLALRCDDIGALAPRPEDDGKVMPSSPERASTVVSDFLQSSTIQR